MGLIVVIAVFGVLYVIYGLIVDNVEKKQSERNPKVINSLEDYTTKKTLFNQYSDYLYKNINNLQAISNLNSIRNKIEGDFPNYGAGIRGFGITSDFTYFGMIIIQDNFKTRLGRTFDIISIAYPNFNKFTNDLYNTGIGMNYVEGGYYSEFGDSIKSKVFYIELLKRKARYYFGLNHGSLFAELRISNTETFEYNSSYTTPISKNKILIRDISVQQYNTYFNATKEDCVTHLLIRAL